MEASAMKHFKRRLSEGKAKSENSRMSKKKKRKEPKIKLSNYEKAVRKFNLNQQLCAQSKIENRRITRGPLKINPARDGIFLKAKRSSFVRKKMLNDANEARKNEDINKIIDIGNEVHTRDLDVDTINEDGGIFKYLNLPKIHAGEKKSRERGKLDLTESDVLCSQNHDDSEESGVCRRNCRQGEVFLASTKSSSADSSDSELKKFVRINRESRANDMESTTLSGTTTFTHVNISGYREKPASPFNIRPEDYLCRRGTNSESGIYDDLIKTGTSNSTSLTFPCTSTRMSKSRRAQGDKLKIGLEDFEEFTVRIENALAKDECPKMNVPGIAETVLRSLKMLYRRRMKIYEDRKMREGVHHVQEDELKSKKTNDPMFTWFFDAASRNKSGDSPWISLSKGVQNAKSDSNIFTFSYAERVELMRKSSVFSDFTRPVDIFQDRKEVHLQNAIPDIYPFSEELKRNLL